MKFKRPRTKNDLTNDPRVETIEADNSGWYVWLEAGFAFDGERRGNLDASIRDQCLAMETVVEVPHADGNNVYPHNA
tara:strand:- start:3481 stop:3711 length:231 start_codon:yes stop_codon:yes gene_type:complete